MTSSAVICMISGTVRPSGPIASVFQLRRSVARQRVAVPITQRVAVVIAGSLRRLIALLGARRLRPLRLRQSGGNDHYRKNDTEQNKTDRAHGSSPSPSFRRMLCDCSRYLGSQELGGSKEEAPGVPGLGDNLRRMSSAPH